MHGMPKCLYKLCMYVHVLEMVMFKNAKFQPRQPADTRQRIVATSVTHKAATPWRRVMVLFLQLPLSSCVVSETLHDASQSWLMC